MTRRALVAFAIRVASAAIAYGTHVLLARWLSLEQYGLFSAAWTWLLIAGGTLPLGFNVVVIGQVPRYLVAGDKERVRGVAVTAFGLTAGVSVLVTGLALCFLALRPSFLDDDLASLAILALLCLPLLAVAEVSEGLARAMGWIGSALVPAYVARPLLMLASGAVLMANGVDVDAAVVLACALLATVVTALAQSVWIGLQFVRSTGRGKIKLETRAWILLSLPMLATEASELLLASMDVLFVAGLAGASEAGLYFAAQRSIALVGFIGFAVGAAAARSVAASVGDRTRLAREVRGAATLSFWPTLAAAFILVLAAPQLLSLFGPGYADGAAIMGILAVGYVARSFVGPAELLLSVIGAARACAGILAAHVAISLGLNASLVPAFGLVGAALAASLTMVSLSLSFAAYGWFRLRIVLAPSLPWSGPARELLARR